MLVAAKTSIFRSDNCLDAIWDVRKGIEWDGHDEQVDALEQPAIMFLKPEVVPQADGVKTNLICQATPAPICARFETRQSIGADGPR